MSTSASASDPRSAARSTAARAQERVRTEGERLVGAAKHDAEEFATEKRDDATGYLADVADALRSAETTLNERNRGGTAGVFHRAADEVGHLADRVHGQNVGRMVDEVEMFARTRPAAFFGGAFLLGFLATRLLTAISDDSHGDAGTSSEIAGSGDFEGSGIEAGSSI